LLLAFSYENIKKSPAYLNALSAAWQDWTLIVVCGGIFIMELSCENCVNEKIIHKGKYDIFIECQDCFRGCAKKLDACCIQPDLIFINMPRSDGKPTKRNYCKNCHHVSALVKMTNPNEWIKLQILTRDQANDLQRERNERVSKFYRYLMDKKQKAFEDQKEEQRRYYNDVYLKSMEWKDKAKRVLNRDKYICQACLINPANEVHHLTYDRIYKEPLFDLVSVCSNCHRSIHGLEPALFSGAIK
jgi:hypothetical protein